MKPAFFIYTGLILAAVFTYFWLKYLITRAKHKKDFEMIFKDWRESKPALEIGSSYGWPTFTITFKIKSDFELAMKNNLIDAFKEKVKSSYGPKFDTDRAFSVVYAKR